MSFARQTSAFFDEFTKIIDAQNKERDAHIDKTTERPFTSELTQDEEPINYDQNPYQAEESEPEVFTRAGG